MFADQLKLHFIVLIWGFTAILGALITVPAVEVVFFRTMIAAVALFAIMYQRKERIKLSVNDTLRLLGTGALVSAHWICFFAAVKLSGASIGLIGLSTATLWTSLLSPFFSDKKLSYLEVFLSIMVILGLSLIAGAQFDDIVGLTLSVVAAFIAAIFSLLNGVFTKTFHHRAIAFYEMFGAFFTTALFLPLYQATFAQNHLLQLIPSLQDWVLLAVLALVCTVYAYAECVELLKRLSVFTANLTVNLEPIYGIVLAAIFLGEHEKLTPEFYIGSAIIIGSVLLYPVLTRWNPVKWRRV